MSTKKSSIHLLVGICSLDGRLLCPPRPTTKTAASSFRRSCPVCNLTLSEQLKKIDFSPSFSTMMTWFSRQRRLIFTRHWQSFSFTVWNFALCLAVFELAVAAVFALVYSAIITRPRWITLPLLQTWALIVSKCGRLQTFLPASHD